MKEFDLISEYLKPLAGEGSHNFSDDCASFGEFVITKDILSSGIHFFANDDAFNLARKAIRVNLSDLASCGAQPFGIMLGLALPKDTSQAWLKRFTQGLKSDLEEFNLSLLGGDTVYHAAPLVISITAIGKTPHQILRSGAKIGDNIFVSGEIGKGLLGLDAKLKGEKNKFYEHYELPTPRIELGLKLRNIANSCIDISDGLLADLWHICEESRVGAEIFSKQIPVSKPHELMKLITGGDDYELCFTTSEDNVEGCYKIGKIINQNKLLMDGAELSPKGYEHKPKA